MKIAKAYIEITNQCNLNCRTCFNRSGLNREVRSIAFDKLSKAIWRLADYGADDFSFGGGEPLLYPELNALMEFMWTYQQFYYSFSTNGTVYNQRFLELYHILPKMNLQVSIDGSCKEVYSLTRGQVNFDKIVDFIKLLRNPNKKTRLKMVISKYNLYDVENFYNFAINLDAVPDFAFVFHSGNAIDNWEDMCLNEKEKATVIRLIDQLNQKQSVKAFLPLCTMGCPLSDQSKDLGVYVKVDGSIMPCQLLYDDSFALGNIFDFDKNHFERRCKEVVDLVRQRENTDYGCSRCLIQTGCHKGCMAMAFDLTGDPLACDGGCEIRKLQFVQQDLIKHLQTSGQL